MAASGEIGGVAQMRKPIDTKNRAGLSSGSP